MGKMRQTSAANGSGAGAGHVASDDEPALVIFGKDEAGKPHAARFAAADIEPAERAAALMGFQAVRVTTPEIRATALELPAGRIYAESGRSFAPFVKTGAYDALSALEGLYRPELLPEPDESSLPFADVPRTWAAISAGSLVLASCGDESGAWYPAVVVEPMPDDLLTLRWRDWPDWDAFLRRPDSLALLSAAA